MNAIAVCSRDVVGQRCQRIREVSGERLDEAGMVVELSQLVDHGSAGTDHGARVLDVFEVLPARRVRAVCGRDEGERALDAVVAHLTHGVGEQRMPVAVAPVDGQRVTGRRELGVQSGDERTIVRVDRAHAIHDVVLLGDLPESLRRHVATLGDVLEERHDVVGPLGAAERDDHDGVVHRAHGPMS